MSPLGEFFVPIFRRAITEINPAPHGPGPVDAARVAFQIWAITALVRRVEFMFANLIFASLTYTSLHQRHHPRIRITSRFHPYGSSPRINRPLVNPHHHARGFQPGHKQQVPRIFKITASSRSPARWCTRLNPSRDLRMHSVDCHNNPGLARHRKPRPRQGLIFRIDWFIKQSHQCSSCAACAKSLCSHTFTRTPSRSHCAAPRKPRVNVPLLPTSSLVPPRATEAH